MQKNKNEFPLNKTTNVLIYQAYNVQSTYPI